MNKLFVLKDVPYASKVGGGTIASIKEVNQLAPGALAVFTERGVLISIDTAANAALNMPDVKVVQVVVGRKDETQVVQVPKALLSDIRVADYSKPNKGSIFYTFPATLDEGEGSLLIQDNSFTSRYSTRRLEVTLIKKAGETTDAYRARLVAEINKSDWLIADGTNANEIEVQIKADDTASVRTILNGSKDGVLADVEVVNLDSYDYGQGTGEDVLQLEKDFSVEEGNGNYTEYGQDFYKRTMEADSTADYDIVNILWEGRHSSPTRSHNVMRNRLVLACINGATDQSVTDLQAFLEVTLADKTVIETGQDDGGDTGGQNPDAL